MRPSHVLIVKRFIINKASLAAYILLFSCSTLDAPANATPDLRQAVLATSMSSVPQGSPPSVVKTSTALVSAAPRAQYFLMKRVYSNMLSAHDFYVADDSRPFDLASCYSAAEDFRLSDEDPTNRLILFIELAHDVVRIRKVLTKLRYPESVWLPLLLQFEEEQIVLYEKGMSKSYSDQTDSGYNHLLIKMERALRRYRQRRVPKLPEVVYDGGCGSGEVDVALKTEPADGRVILIPVFFFKLCRAQKIDPDDMKQCDHWREPVEGLLTELSGDYFYRASWPGGVERRGLLSLTNIRAGQTITIRKP